MESVFIALSLLLIYGVAGEEITVKVGETLRFGVEKTPDQTFLWYFGGVLIAQINGDASTTCLYDGVDGMFRDRLQVNYNTGDLIIKNVTVEHSGLYEANDLIKKTDGKTETLQNNKPQKCNREKISRVKFGNNIKTFTVTVSESNMEARIQDPINKSNMEARIQDPINSPAETEMSPGAIAGICVGGVGVLLLAAAAGVIYYKRRNSGENPEKYKQVTTHEKPTEV